MCGNTFWITSTPAAMILPALALSRMFPASFSKFTPVKSSIPQNTRPQKVLPTKRFLWIGARAFDLSFDDMPNEDKPAQDLAKIFLGFNSFEYDLAYVSKWSCACKRGGCKEPGFAKVITNEKVYCLIDERFLPPFRGISPRIKGENTGIMFQYGFDDAMTAFILPVRLDKESTDIYKAIQSQVMKEVEDMKR